jgi:hypothetical protein
MSLFLEGRIRLGVLPNLYRLSLTQNHGKLVVCVGFEQIVVQIALTLVRQGFRWFPFVRYRLILVKVGEQIHLEGVLLVKFEVVGEFDSFGGVHRRRVLQEDVAFRVSGLGHGIIFVDYGSKLDENFVDHGFELLDAVGADLRDSIDDDHAFDAVGLLRLLL